MRNKKGQYVKGHPTRKRTRVVVRCLFCTSTFFAQPHRFKNGRGKYCSRKCSHLGMYTKEVRDKMSKTRKGKPVPERQREKCHFWKGGVTPINKMIRMSLESRVWRESVFKRDNWTCVMCHKRGTRLQADHIKPFAMYPRLRFKLANGRTLCFNCHKKTDTYGGKNNKKENTRTIKEEIVGVSKTSLS